MEYYQTRNFYLISDIDSDRKKKILLKIISESAPRLKAYQGDVTDRSDISQVVVPLISALGQVSS
jgi:hypothetical protein